ncbi:hypothetical protein ACFSO9_15185 [Mesonia maritima]|uniref:Ig-like domain-containing protein n=1 Tax=Mesonia maritima TaxID=1793873 RepID=UPI0036379A9D
MAGQTLEDFTGFSNGIVTDPHSGPSIFLQWYPDNNGMPDFNNPIVDPTSEIITDQDVYHVTQNVGNCESDYLTVTFNEISCDTDLGGVSGAQGDSVCENGQLTLSITNPSQYDDSSEVYWFDSASGGEIVGVGDTFTTPDLSQTTSYWATEVFLGLGTITGQANPGPVTGSTSNANNGLYINAEETIIINTVDVYSAGSGNIIIEIKNQSGTYSETISRSVNAGTTADPTLTTLTINRELPGNDDYYIYKSSGPSLLYTPSANATFPYPLGPSASITSGATSTGATNSSYYYFYNWDIKGSTVLCETSPREEVVATVYDIEPISVSATDRIVCVNGTTDLTATSTDPDYQYTWTWNDSSGSNTDTGATITPTILGNTTFTVEAYNPNTTCSTSATIDITANGVEDLGVIPTSAQVCSDEIVRLTAGSEIYDFNNGSNGWTTQNNSTSPIGNAAATGWQIVNSPFSPNGYALENISSPDDSDYYISIADKLGSGGVLDNSLISPSFNLVGVASAELSFDYLFKDYTTSSYSTNNVTYFDVLVSEDQGATWEVVDNNIPGEFDPENFQSRTVDLDEYAGKSGVMIAFNFNGSWGWWLAIDNVVFKRDFADGFVSWSPTNDLYLMIRLQFLMMVHLQIKCILHNQMMDNTHIRQR